MAKKIYIKTFGCQMNEYDSDKMVDVMHAAEGYETTQDPEEADLILFNTCSVREKAQEKVFSDLGRVKHLKERGVKISETGRDQSGTYDALITLSVTTPEFTREITGTVFANGVPRIVDLKGIALEASFAPHMLYVTNEDKPGFIGRFGMLLGDAGAREQERWAGRMRR